MPLPADRPPPSALDPDALAHAIRDPLAVALARTELLHRRAARGDVDCARLVADLAAVRAALQRIAAATAGLARGDPGA